MGQTQNSRANNFYEMCRDGNIRGVRELLPQLTYEELNYREPISGHTPLHAACSNNHQKIVQLLLEQKACNRIILNRNGTTAYDVATSPNIRTLFNRGSNRDNDNRFVDTNDDQSAFRLSSNSTASSECPNNWLKGHISVKEANDSQLMVALSQSSNPIMKRFIKTRTEKESQERIYLLIHCNIPFSHPGRESALQLYQEYVSSNSVEPLITLYSLETPLYRALQSDADAYTLILYLHLDQLRKRTFRGDTYRGATMTVADLDAYRWAHKNSAILETRSLQSTSKSIDVANQFAPSLPSNSIRLSVILHFQFNEICPSAIDIKGLSYFPEEEEVLLLPFTLFKVTSIQLKNINDKEQHEITMENISVPQHAPWTIARKIAQNQ